MASIHFLGLIAILIGYGEVGAASVNVASQVITFSKESNEHIYSAIKHCAGNQSKTVEFMKIVQEGKYREDDEFKNFIHCSYKNAGYSFEDGRVNVELSFPLYPDPEAMLKVMKLCDKERGTTPVDTTFVFFKCFQERSPFLIGMS